MPGAAVRREFSGMLSSPLPSEHKSSDGDWSCPDGSHRESFRMCMRSLQSAGVDWFHFLPWNARLDRTRVNRTGTGAGHDSEPGQLAS
jgi:hypothetical protein